MIDKLIVSCLFNSLLLLSKKRELSNLVNMTFYGQRNFPIGILISLVEKFFYLFLFKNWFSQITINITNTNDFFGTPNIRWIENGAKYYPFPSLSISQYMW